MVMSEPGRRIIMVALPVETQLANLPSSEQADAVNDAIDSIGTVPGIPIDLPTADPGHPYQALRTNDPDAPVVIYRKTRPDEEGDFVVVSLMTPEQYTQQKADEKSGLLTQPAVREAIRVTAGAAAQAAVSMVETMTKDSPPADAERLRESLSELLNLAREGQGSTRHFRRGFQSHPVSPEYLAGDPSQLFVNWRERELLIAARQQDEIDLGEIEIEGEPYTVEVKLRPGRTGPDEEASEQPTSRAQMRVLMEKAG
jgi:hypothetical protein